MGHPAWTFASWQDQRLSLPNFNRGFSMSQATPAPSPLAAALDQNDAVRETVKQSADELLVINAVLKQEIPDHVQTGEVVEALQRTDALEERIQESVDELAQVNQVLEQEIDERMDLERELAAAKAALAQAGGKP
jgi:C4-dicarboxylate-specific signal transduction histidine kinase